jgi:hypothetical protein
MSAFRLAADMLGVGVDERGQIHARAAPALSPALSDCLRLRIGSGMWVLFTAARSKRPHGGRQLAKPIGELNRDGAKVTMLHVCRVHLRHRADTQGISVQIRHYRRDI